MDNYLTKVDGILSQKNRSTKFLNENNQSLIDSVRSEEKPKENGVFTEIFNKSKKK